MKKALRPLRKTIGVIINEIDENYQINTWNGIRKEAENLDVNLLCFCGMALKPPTREQEERNIIYEMIQTDRIDGLIIVTGTMELYVDTDEIEKFIHAYRDLPIVSLSIPLQGAYNVLLDNRSAMKMIFDHLTQTHAYQRIAFISGPLNNQEATIRMQAFREYLNQQGITVIEDFVYEGNFSHDSGRKAIRHFLSQSSLPDVIVAANDEMAIGAFWELQERGYHVPQDIAITGFDDIAAAKAFYPPFTTIAQPLQEMGMKSVELLWNLFNHKEVPINSYIEGELIIRESCGCFRVLNDPLTIYSHKLAQSELSLDAAFLLAQEKLLEINTDYLEHILAKMQINHPDFIDTNHQIHIFFDDLLDDIKNQRIEGQFIKTLNFIIQHSLVANSVDSDWYDVLSWIRQEVINVLNHPVLLEVFQNICYTASILIGNILSSREKFYHYHFDQIYLTTRWAVEGLNKVTDKEQLQQALSTLMDQYKIKEYYLCLYEKTVIHQCGLPFEAPQTINIAQGRAGSKLIINEAFQTKEMLPDSYLYHNQRNDFIFYALYAENEHFGYIVFGLKDVVDMRFLETVRQQVNFTLSRLRLNEQRTEAEKYLTLAINALEKYNQMLQTLSVRDELTKLYNRRGFYKEAERFYNHAVYNNLPFFVIFGDLDGLKSINDRYGHHEGDYAISQTANILKESCKPNDIIGRMGGDEFIIISPDTENKGVQDLLHRINNNVKHVNQENRKPFKLSISLGYVASNFEKTESLETLIALADEALYQTKNHRKSNRC